MPHAHSFEWNGNMNVHDWSIKSEGQIQAILWWVANIDDLSFLCGLRTKNFKKAKNEEPSSSRGTYHLQLKNSLLDGILSYGTLPNSNSHLMVFYMLNGCKCFLAYFNLNILLLPWLRHRVKSQVLRQIKCYVRNSNT